MMDADWRKDMRTNEYPGRVKMNGVKLDLFTEDDLREIDYATKDVLSTYGVQVSDDEGLKIFEEAGCDVNYETKMVKIPVKVINQALATVPKKFYLYGREDRHTVEQMHKGRVHFTCFGTGIQMCDYLGDGKFNTRDSTEADLANCAKLVDWAENISYFSLAVSARDWAGIGAGDVHEMLVSLKNTSKHFHHIDPVAENVDFYWEMLKAYYGGDEEMARNRPIMSMLVCPTSPLELSHNAVQVIVKGARYGIPVNVLSMAMAGGSSPIHLTGTLVTHNAEVLSGIVLSQIANPGAPVLYGSSTTTFDLRNGTAPVGSPELAIISAAVAKLGQYYGLPVFVAGM
jgi:trimethylamine--corrinoid protein Co-methyltransferase